MKTRATFFHHRVTEATEKSRVWVSVLILSPSHAEAWWTEVRGYIITLS